MQAVSLLASAIIFNFLDIDVNNMISDFGNFLSKKM